MPFLSLLNEEANLSLPLYSDSSSLGDLIERIGQLSEDQFREKLASGELRGEPTYAGVWEFGLQVRGPVSSADITEFYRYSPTLALELITILAETPGIGYEDPDSLSHGIAGLFDLFQVDPRPLRSTPWSWGILSNYCSRYRDLILELCRKALPYDGIARRSRLYRRFGNTDSVMWLFRLFRDSGESAVIPYAVDLILGHMQFFYSHKLDNTDSSPPLPPGAASEVLASRTQLANAATDPGLCWSVRCSAGLLLLMIEPNSIPSQLTPVAPLVVQHYNSKDGYWLLAGLVTVVSMAVRNPSPIIASLLRDLFESCREDYSARTSLEEILMVWRESSTAPVTSQGLRDRWLYRTDQ
jgi:hypothetical protein